jgi:hypothetical protein
MCVCVFCNVCVCLCVCVFCNVCVCLCVCVCVCFFMCVCVGVFVAVVSFCWWCGGEGGAFVGWGGGGGMHEDMCERLVK